MYDEHGVRMPDPVQKQRLVYSNNHSRRFHSEEEEEEDVLGRAEDPSVDWLFPPPLHLSYPGTLEQVAAEYTSYYSRYYFIYFM